MQLLYYLLPVTAGRQLLFMGMTYVGLSVHLWVCPQNGWIYSK